MPATKLFLLYYLYLDANNWELNYQYVHFRLEVSFIRRTSMIKGFSTALSVFTERFILFAAIVAFVVMGGDIRAEITFSLVQYFNLLQLACNIFFPLALALLAETRVSVRRLEVNRKMCLFDTDVLCLFRYFNVYILFRNSCYWTNWRLD